MQTWRRWRRRSEQVLLVDACLQTPQQHALFRVSNVHGFSEVLGRRWAACVQKNVAPGWTCYPLVLGPGCGRLFSQHAWKRCSSAAPVACVGGHPPVCCSPDALLVGQSTAGVLLVVCKHRDRRTEVQESVAKLHGAQVPCLGSVLVREMRSRAPFCITNC
ncbi:MAG: hypothetical protein ACLS8R_09475 [Anaeromassilibacillus sp.]